MKRNRFIYASLTGLTIILGLLSRKINGLPSFIDSYAGDTLWALMVFFLFATIFNKKSTVKIAIYSLVFSYLIEFSQLYHAPWIDSIRATTLGALVLGFGFLFSDIICYTVGIIIGVFIDRFNNLNC